MDDLTDVYNDLIMEHSMNSYNKKTLELFKKHGYIVQMGYILFDKETTYQELVENYQFMLDYDFAVTKGVFSEMFSAEGTALNTRLRNENKLQESDFINNNNNFNKYNLG